MNDLVKISEETIKEIIAKFYNIRADDVCLYHDYKFVLKNGDKVRENFIYGIIDKRNSSVKNEKMAKTDSISRQAAIEAVEESRRSNPHEDSKVALNHEYEHRHFLNILLSLPSTQPEQIKMIKEIRKWINSGNRGSADYFIVDKIEEIIDKYE